MSSSVSAQSALMAVTWLTLKLNLDIKQPEHIPGSTMGVVDDLSKGYKHSMPKELEIPLHLDIKIKQLFAVCDPTKRQNLQEHFIVFEKIQLLIDGFLSL